MRSKSHLKALHLLLLSFALFLTIGLGGPTLLRAIEPAHSDLDAVWQRVQQSGAYRFSADMTQTDTPLATVRNAGRQGRVSTYFMQGETNLAAEMLHLMIWSESGSTLLPDSGMELEVDGHRARSRQGDGDWQAVDDFSGLFAPGGDFLAYSRMAKNVALHEPERRSTVAGEVEVTRFSFELDGRAYAMEMTKQMRAQAAREGLPASVRFDLPKVYKEMTGTGELWVGADGLPLRQLFAMNFPETGENSISSVEVTVDFSDFAELPSVGWQRWVQPWLRSATRAAVVPESWLMLFAVALVLVGIALLVAHRRARPVYVAVVVAAIGAMVAVPLLNGHQIHAYGIRQQAKQEKQKAERTRGEAAEQMRAALRTIDFAPNRAPLERAQKEAAHEEAALAVMQQDNDDDDDDEEYDGRYFEESCETDPNGDADGDTLTNLEECLLGTLTTVADTDEDGLDDNLEVAGFSYGGQIWYTNPLEIDSNRDGLDDGKEWLLDVDKNGVPDDTDGDGTPDLWDEDNDGDGAPDDLDLSVYIHTGGESAARIGESKRFDEEKPLQLRFNELQAGELIDVEFQLTPTNPEHLWYSRNVLDWPMNDKQGQIQDVDGATFYDLNSNLDPSPNDNGDMRMVPMLEIEMPADSANLPPAESCITEEGKTVDCYPLLDQFGIAVQQTSENALAAYVPLQLVSDSSGDEKVAFYGRMLYQASGLWRDAHDVRLVWVIQALNDICEVYKDNICQSYSDYNELQIVQTYYDEWSLTGLMLTEEHNADVALIYEEPAQVEAEPDAYGAPLYLDNLYQLLYGLDFSFLAGRDCESVDADGDCVGNGERDITVPEIARRFDHATNGDVSDDERWGMPNVFSVVTNEYESLDLGAMDTAITQTVQVLDDVFTERWSANEPITPTIMVATEHSYRAFNFDQIIGDPTNLKWDANLLTINLAQGGEHAVGVETVASLKWTPYAYDPVDGWEAAEIIGYWDTLTAQLGNRFDDYADEEEVETYHTMAQVLYLAVHQGSSSVVESDGLIYSQSYQGLDKEIMKGIAAPTKRALQVVLGSYFHYQDALKLAAEQVRARESFNYVWKFQTKYHKYLENQTALYGGKLLAMAAVAFTAVALLVLVTALVFKYMVGDSWSGWDTVVKASLLVLVSINAFITPILRAIQSAKLAVQAGEFASLGPALWSKLTTVKKMGSAGMTMAIIGLVISISIAVGIFLWAWGSGIVSAGEIAFNELLAQTISAIIVAIIVFVLSLTALGSLILATIIILDLILDLAGADFTLMGAFTGALAGLIYRFNLDVDYDVDVGTLHKELADPGEGFVAGNKISVSLPITTQLRAFSSNDLLVHSVVYELNESERALKTDLGERKDDYTLLVEEFGSPSAQFYVAEVVDAPVYSQTLQPGVNRELRLYLNSGYAFQGEECWLFFCNNRTVDGNASENLGNIALMDVLPDTLDDFARVDEWGGRGGVRFLDPDGDGLLARSAGGLDPDNSAWDSDNDGLSDWYELTLRSRPFEQGGVNLDPMNPDSDGDDIPDGTEINLGSNPGLADSDGDGLTDAQELMPTGGWSLPYRYDPTSGTVTETRVWSDPFQADGDGDGLSDLFERTRLTCPTCTPWADPDNPEVYNPNVWNESPVALYVEDNTVDGFISPDETVVYTTTTENNLGSGQELVGVLSLDVPGGVDGGPLDADVNIGNGESASLISNLRFASQDSATYDFTSATQLTNFYDTRWTWDAASQSGQAALAGALETVSIARVNGWDAPFVVATYERTETVPSINVYMVKSDGTVVNSINLNTSNVLTRELIGPDIACNEQGTCLVIWGEEASSPTTPDGSMWVQYVKSGLRMGNKAQVELGRPVAEPSVATDGTDFMVAWSGYASQNQTTLEYIVSTKPGSGEADGGVAKRIDTLDTTQGAITVEWNGSTYTAIWAGDGNLHRADIRSDGWLNSLSVIGAGGGWPQSDITERAPALAYDALSNGTLLAYRDPSGSMVARILTADNTGDPFPLVESDVDGNDVTVALRPDNQNGGWVMAWVTDETVNYLAISPSGILRGDLADVEQTALTAVALICGGPRMLLEFPFDEEADATSFTDVSGNEHEVVCDGACPQSGVRGRIGNAVAFNGINQALKVDDFHLTNQSYTIAAWLEFDSANTIDGFPISYEMLDTESSNSLNFLIAMVMYRGLDSRLRVGCWLAGPKLPGGGSEVLQVFAGSGWHHWACTYDGTTQQHTLYQDGVQKRSQNINASVTGSAPLYIGRLPEENDAPDAFWSGALDEVMIADRALSADEIADLAQGARAAYSLDEAAGSELFVNAIGNEFTGRCESAATCPTPGVPGAAFTAAEFDGQDDHIALGTQDNSLPLANSSFTLSAWAKRKQSGQMDFLLSQGTLSAYHGLFLGYLDSNNIRCGFTGDDLTSSQKYSDTDGWHHIVCTYDAATRTRTIYRDGQQIAQNNPTQHYQGSGLMYMGQKFDNSRYFQGAIDEVGIWASALSADQVQTLYQKIKVDDEAVLACQLPAATGDTLVFNKLVLRKTTTELGEINQHIERSITADNDVPDVSISADYFGTEGNPGYVRSQNTLVVAGEADDPSSYVAQVEVNAGSGWQSATGTESWVYAWPTTGLSDGLQTLQLRATDAVGNVSATSSWTTILDNAAPVATLSAPQPPLRPYRDALGRWSVPLRGNVADPAAGTHPGSGVQAVDLLFHGIDHTVGLGWQAATLAGDGTWQIDYILPGYIGDNHELAGPTGTYSITVRATDALSNTTASEAYPTTLITLDAAGPGVAASDALSNTLHISNDFNASGVVSDTTTVTAVEVNFTPAQQIGSLNGVVLHLPFDDRQTTSYFVDQSGANNVAICGDTPPGEQCPTVGVPGQRDRAVRFDGTSQSLHVDTVDLANESFTLAAWVKRNGSGHNDFILSQGKEGNLTAFSLGYRETDHLRCSIWGKSVDSASAYADTDWHHTVCTFDATTSSLRLYQDGTLVGEATTSGAYIGTGPLYIGKRFDNTRYLHGSVDEVAIYQRALAESEIANLYAYGQGTWEAATLTDGTWHYDIPTGAEGLEGLYQLNVRGIDAVSNVTPQGGQRIWRGEIDTRPPQVTFTAEADTSGNTTTTTYTCTATDFNLVEERTCLPGETPDIPHFRDSDATLTSYAEVDPWYAANITDTARLYAMEAERTYPYDPVAGQTMTACDAYDQCSQVSEALLPTTAHLLDAEILGPSGGTVLTTTEPVAISGEVYAVDGLRALAVDVNGATLHTQQWDSAETTTAAWQFQWTPPGEGIYRFEPVVDSWAGETPPARTGSVQPVVTQSAAALRQREQRLVTPPDQLTERIYLPVAATSRSSNGGLSTDGRIYLPLVATEGEPITGAFTGTVTTIYVDLAPPTVAFDATVLTSTNALGEPIVLLTGRASDSVQLHRVDVRIGQGPWQRAGLDGVESGRENWQWQWWFDAPPDGETFTVSARAEDLAGHTATVTETVTVDTVAPATGEITLHYVTNAGERLPVMPGSTLNDATALAVTWEAVTDASGPVHYEVGFSTDSTPAATALTRYDAAGTHTMPVTAGERWYATVRFVDAAGNASVVTLGPVRISSN